MKNKFVLDENIIISTITSKNERGEDDYSASILLLSIAHNCHKILLTPKINVKYYQKFNEIQKNKTKSIDVHFLHIFNHLMSNSDKIIWEEDIDGNLETVFDPNDAIYVSLAARKHAILTTVDDKLIRDLTNSKLPVTNQFIVIRPENALGYASYIN